MTRKNKYGNTPTTVDGVRFASLREARRYGELKVMERCGLISGLELQPPFDLAVNGVHVCRYVADFAYVEKGERVVEDAKGMPTPEYRLKRKLLLAVHGIAVREV